MKSLLLSFVLVNSLLSFDYKLQPKEVGAYTHCFFGLPEVMDKRNNGNMSNSCFVNVGSAYLVIDSGPTYQYATQAYTAMKKIKNLPIAYVINTHIHDDHWLGNSYYAKEGISIIGSDTFANEEKVAMTRMQRRISPEAYKGTRQIFPTIFVKHEKILDFNGTKVQLERVNQKAHTKSDLYVYIPKYRIVFTGDLVFNERLPSIRDGNLDGWLKALDTIKKLDVDYIVGGHGELVNSDAINMTYAYIKELREGVAKLLEEGENIADVVNKVTMKKYENIPFYDSTHRQNVETTYRMLEWEIE
ncbi:MBL fold metallo-hydrolase [Sulfurimonas sp.]